MRFSIIECNVIEDLIMGIGIHMRLCSANILQYDHPVTIKMGYACCKHNIWWKINYLHVQESKFRKDHESHNLRIKFVNNIKKLATIIPVHKVDEHKRFLEELKLKSLLD